MMTLSDQFLRRPSRNSRKESGACGVEVSDVVVDLVVAAYMLPHAHRTVAQVHRHHLKRPALDRDLRVDGRKGWLSVVYV